MNHTKQELKPIFDDINSIPFICDPSAEQDTIHFGFDNQNDNIPSINEKMPQYLSICRTFCEEFIYQSIGPCKTKDNNISISMSASLIKAIGTLTLLNKTNEMLKINEMRWIKI